MKFRRQGKLLTGSFKLLDGRLGRAVIPISPGGAVTVLAGAGDNPNPLTWAQASEQIHPQDMVDLLCAKERLHGQTLPKFDLESE